MKNLLIFQKKKFFFFIQKIFHCEAHKPIFSLNEATTYMKIKENIMENKSNKFQTIDFRQDINLKKKTKKIEI